VIESPVGSRAGENLINLPIPHPDCFCRGNRVTKETTI
jgi:hypothetical protein